MKKIFAIITFLTLLSSCSYKYTPATSAMINVSNYNIGNLNKLKSGESCSVSFLGISDGGSTSVIDAMRNGNISTIKMVDKKYVVAPLFLKTCTIVHGL